MDRLLTVGISETYGNKFKIIAIHQDEKFNSRFISLDVNKFHKDGNPTWDNLAFTEVDELIDKSGNGEICQIKGDEKIVDRVSKDDLKKIFLKHKESWKSFNRNKDKRYTVIKVDYIDNIFYDSKKKNHRMNIVSNGEEIKDLLNKDYRWIQYWNHYIDKYEEKSKYYKDYLNKTDKEIYLVIYKHKFKHGGYGRWIVGLHCL